MQQEGDDTIRAEVIRHCAARTKVIRRAHQVAEMREQLADERFALLQSTRRLARANAYAAYAVTSPMTSHPLRPPSMPDTSVVSRLPSTVPGTGPTRN